MLERNLMPELLAALADMPAAHLIGARQVGKSTLAREVANEHLAASYLTLDDAATRGAALADPTGFLRDLSVPTVIDEVQRAPDLLLAVKAAIDEARAAGERPASGLFLLTGSATPWARLDVADALVGRVARLQLWPLSQGELAGRRETFIDKLMAGRPPRTSADERGRRGVAARVVQGGFPEVVAGSAGPLPDRWFANYIGTVLEREVRSLSSIRALEELPRLLTLLAARSGGILNVANLAQDLSQPQSTTRRYLDLLHAVFLVQLLPAWRTGVRKRVIKSPKVHLVDSGLMSHLLGCDEQRFVADRSATPGALFETFVANELGKQVGWAAQRVGLYHYRDVRGSEVDVVLEAGTGEVCGVEAKLTESVGERDFRGLKDLRDVAGDRFRAGVVLYAGGESLPFGDRLWALPVAVLWS